MTSLEAAIDAALVEQTGTTASIHRDEHVYGCPFCSKGAGHFCVNFRKGVYNCFVCGEENPDARGSVRKLARLLGVEWEEDSVQVEDALEETTPRDDEAPVDLPPDFELLLPAASSRHISQFCYLHSRGLNWEDIISYRLGVACGGTRVVFPDFNAYGQVRWWLGRALSEYVKPKYQGPSGERWGKIGNYYRAITASPGWIGVVEGPMDGIVAGPEFVWLFGKGHTQEQVEVLVATKRQIVIALDGEMKAVGSAQSLAKDLRGHGARCLFCGLPAGEDPASYGRVPFRRLLAQTLTQDDETLSELDYLRLAAEGYL